MAFSVSGGWVLSVVGSAPCVDEDVKTIKIIIKGCQMGSSPLYLLLDSGKENNLTQVRHKQLKLTVNVLG